MEAYDYEKETTNLDLISNEIIDSKNTSTKVLPLTKKKSSMKDDLNDLKKILKDEEKLNNSKNLGMNVSDKEVLN